jgi:hypothetical protein
MKRAETIEVVTTRSVAHQAELETSNTQLAEALRKDEFRIAIEASTARILSIALYGPDDSDPEAA